MIEHLQEKVGVYKIENGQRGGVESWPTLDVNGQPVYGRGGTQAHLDETRFVIIPQGFKKWPLLDEFKAALGIAGPIVAQPEAPDNLRTGGPRNRPAVSTDTGERSDG